MHCDIMRYVAGLAAAALLSAAAPPVAWGVQNVPPLLQVRLASEGSVANHDRMSVVAGGKAVYVGRTNIAADDVVASARATKVAGGLVLEITLTPEGASRLAAATAGQEGKLIAVIIDSKLISTSPLMGALESPHVIITAQMTPELASALHAKVAAKWPRHRKGSGQQP